MAFEIEELIRLTSENSDLGISILQGSGGITASTEQDAADQGSVYYDRAGSGTYYKKTSGTGVDKWIRVATLDDIAGFTWRKENPVAATGDVAPSTGSTIDLVVNPFGDDDAPTLVAADFPVDSHIIFGVGGTPKLMRVSVSAGDDITVVDADVPMAAQDKFLCQNYLPDSGDDQEKQAILHYDGTNIFKISDFNWDIATGINLSSGYAAVNGTVSSADSVESAIEKLDGNQKDLTTLSGVAQGAVDNGTFTGNVISDNVTTKVALQELETELENIDGQAAIDAVTTTTILDSFLVDDFLGSKYEIQARLDGNKAQMKAVELYVGHNGHAGADANAIDKTVYAKLKIGTNFDVNYTVAISGVGAAQVMTVSVVASAAVSVRAHYTRIKAQGL